MQKTILTTDQQTEKVLADELEVELVDETTLINKHKKYLSCSMQILQVKKRLKLIT